MKRRSSQVDELALFLHAHGFAAEVPHTGLTGKRRWRWDWARDRIAVEYHGVGVGHQGVAGSFRDHEKVTEGVLLGYTVIQCNRATVKSGRCYEWIEQAIEQGTQEGRSSGRNHPLIPSPQ